MDNQMIIILAILLLFFMKNKKENMKTGCGWHNDQPCQQNTNTYHRQGWS